jgi:transposase InsO family protein
MHRTLKAETTRPAAGSLAAQQRRFNIFREEFNRERPHEALDQQTPAACYMPLAAADARSVATARVPRSVRGPLRQR